MQTVFYSALAAHLNPVLKRDVSFVLDALPVTEKLFSPFWSKKKEPPRMDLASGLY
jgi:hypothetical protein